MSGTPPTHPDLSTLFTTLFGSDPTTLSNLLGTTDPTDRAALLQALLHTNPSTHPTTTNATTAPTTPTTTTNISVASRSTSHDDDDDPDDVHILSQSAVSHRLSTPPISPHRINSSTGIITTHLEEQRSLQDDDLATQSRRLLDGRVSTLPEATRRLHVVLKLGIPANANSDQAPTTSTLEPVIDAILAALNFPFRVDIVAFINYERPIINASRSSSTYFSFVYLSPHSTKIASTNTYGLEYYLLYARIADIVMGPKQALRNIPDLPPITKFINISTPHINDMNERLEFLIDGVGPRTLLGPEEYDNTDSYRHLGYLLFIALRDCWKRSLPSSRPVPAELSRPQTRYSIMHLISTKKVRMKPPDGTPTIHNMLGVVITQEEPHATVLRNAFNELCIENRHPLRIFGLLNTFELHLHTFPDNNDPARFSLGRTINSHNHQLHLESQFKMVRNVRIHPKFLQKHQLITQAVLGLDKCIAIFCDFSSGHGDLLLTAIFISHRTTSFLNTNTITSLIADHLRSTIDVTPSPLQPSIPTSPPRASYATTTRKNPYHNSPSDSASTTSTQRLGRGRGRGNVVPTPFLNSGRQIIQDRSLGHLRPPVANILKLNLTPTKKYHAVVNAAGGIASANIYHIDFDGGGLRHLTSGVSFAIFHAFDTFAHAFTHFQIFYPHIRNQTDIDHMNSNCCHNTSNLNNPSPTISHHTGPYPASNSQHRECFYYDELPASAQASRMAATRRRLAQGRFITDSYTFEEKPPPVDDVSMSNSFRTAESQHPSNPPTHITTQHMSPPPRTTNSTPPTHITTQHTNPPPSTTNPPTDTKDVADDESEDLLADSQSSANPSPHKRRHTRVHPNTTYVRFTTPIDSDIKTITSTLLHHLNTLPEPLGHCINHRLTSESPPHPQMLDQKVVRFELTQPSPTNIHHVLHTISNNWAHSFPSCTSTDPTAPLPSDISQVSFPPTEWPQYCQVTTCPMHNNELPLVPLSPDGLHTIQQHVQHLHSDIFLCLPPHILSSIGWTRCCTTCPSIFPNTSTHLPPHQALCPHHLAFTTAAQPDQAHYDFSTHDSWKLAFGICPTDRRPDLNALIDSLPEDADHETSLSSVLVTVSQWRLDATSTATSHVHND